ncbi:MAG: tRNA pseudouridine(55) synthase TruB [Bacteroidetes bacterium]|nr:tRNA pseudouridine(55) synthase TruB [Bacteroidota bacterium]
MFLLTRNSIDRIAQWFSEAETTGASVLIDKEKNWTSFDVVAKLRRITKIRKIGHTGTLDPSATGLLIVCLGKATKQISNYKDDFKSYSAQIKIGITTKSYDGETEEYDEKPIYNINENEITNTILSFKGVSYQEPPQYSAKKIKGVPAYKFARKDKQIKLEPKQVEIRDIQIKSIQIPFISFNIVCSAGTYIRAIARDIGEKLGCGAYLYELRRTAIGDFKVEDSLTINEINNLFNENCLISNDKSLQELQ